ncbi:MAG: AMP-binding protein, partial [Clostridiaceae bacterium]|nr:AMP-binding protein [Clostridiaceae bacterium]
MSEIMENTIDNLFKNNKNQHNISYFCTQYQCEIGNGDRCAVRWVFADLSRKDISFQEFEDGSNRCANLLREIGISTGDRVFTFLPKSPYLYFFFLGILKVQAVAGVLFSNFGEEALLDRLADSEARVLLTSKSFLRTIRAIWKKLP